MNRKYSAHFNYNNHQQDLHSKITAYLELMLPKRIGHSHGEMEFNAQKMGWESSVS